MSCPVCCDAYTLAQRKCIQCPRCSYAACARCVKSYLLTQADPGCMSCHVFWCRSFLDANLTSTWRNGELRRHRERVLFDRERSLLPAAQPAVEREAERRVRQAARRALLQRAKELQAELRRTRDEYYRLGTCEAREPPAHRSFVAACPDEDCRGFLTTAYKCGTCLRQFCSKCRELLSEGHECDAAVVESLRAIARESGPCPGCGMAISRVSGCDQMYCTQCDTPFSYSTGLRISGVIHNPHYFERLQHLRTNMAATDCDGWPEFYSLPLGLRTIRYAANIYQSARHVERMVLRELPTVDVVRDNEDLRILYCLKDLSEPQLRQRLQRRERARELGLEKRQILETFVLMALEFFSEPPAPSIAETVLRRQVESLVNAPLRDLGDRYDNKVPQVTDVGYSATAYDPKASRKRSAA